MTPRLLMATVLGVAAVLALLAIVARPALAASRGADSEIVALAAAGSQRAGDRYAIFGYVRADGAAARSGRYELRVCQQLCRTVRSREIDAVANRWSELGALTLDPGEYRVRLVLIASLGWRGERVDDHRSWVLHVE